MNQTLYLLRHAKAEPWEPGINDFQRELSERGKDHMHMLRDWAEENLTAPDIALCSPSARTRETLEPFFSTWPGLEQNTRYLDEIYESSTGTLHALAEEAFQSSSIVLMVGHNPGFEFLATAVMNDEEAARINKMATGTLAVIDFSDGYESDCGEGTLRDWVKRKSLLAY